MNLYDLISFGLSPNAVKSGKIYAFKPVDGAGDLTFSRASSRTRINSSGFIETIPAEWPALNYDSDCPSLSLEPARTNLITRSSELTHSNWSKRGGITITPNAGVAPDGTMSATTATFSDAATNMSTNTIPVTPGQVYTFSWYVKQIDANAIGWGIFDITNSVWVVNSTLYTSELISGEWVRLEKTFTVPENCSGVLCYPTIMSPATGSVQLWGHQLEQGSYATSYIPTGASFASRVADVVSPLTGVSDLIGEMEGSLFVDWTPMISTIEQEFNVDDGTASNRLRISLNPGNTNISLSVVKDGVNQASVATPIVYGERHKILITYKENEFSFYVNGTLIQTDNSGAVPVGMSAIRFTHPTAAQRIVLGNVYGFHLSKTAYPADVAVQLTTL